MKINKFIPISLACVGLSLAGCGTTDGTGDAPISNSINGVLDGYGTDDGYRYNNDDYNNNGYGTGNSGYDANGNSLYNNGYGSNSPYNSMNTNDNTNAANDRFGFGMPGAENIIGNKSTGNINNNKTNSGANNRANSRANNGANNKNNNLNNANNKSNNATSDISDVIRN